MDGELCPLLCIARGASGGVLDDRCMRGKCALWDEGAYDCYSPGCGLVSRENRRI